MKQYESDPDKNDQLDDSGTKKRYPTGADGRKDAGKKKNDGA